MFFSYINKKRTKKEEVGALFSEGNLEIITTLSSLPQNSVNVFPRVSARMQNAVAKAGWLLGVEGRWIGNDHAWGGSGAQGAHCLQTRVTGHSPSSPLKGLACEIAGLQHKLLMTFLCLAGAMGLGNSKCSSCIWERQKAVQVTTGLLIWSQHLSWSFVRYWPVKDRIKWKMKWKSQ